MVFALSKEVLKPPCSVSSEISKGYFRYWQADDTDRLGDEERITKLIKKVFEDKFKKQEQNLAKIISGYLEITMQEIKSLKNEMNQLKKSMEFT